MALIAMEEPGKAAGTVGEIYQGLQAAWGFVPNGAKVWSASPFQLERFVQNVQYYSGHPTLSGRLLAFVRMLVSVGQRCDYCIDMNTGMLLREGFTPEQLAAAKADPAAAPLDGKERGLLLFVLKLVRDPHAIAASDVEAVRALGWTDRDILDAAAHGAGQVAGDTIFSAFKIEREF